MIQRRGAGPQNRLSSEKSRLALIMKQQPAGTVTGVASRPPPATGGPAHRGRGSSIAGWVCGSPA
jgi:hypothetical protein